MLPVEPKPGLSSMTNQVGGGGEQSGSQLLGFPHAGCGVGQGEHLGPGEQIGCELDQGKPDLVLGEAFEWKVVQASIFRDPDGSSRRSGARW